MYLCGWLILLFSTMAKSKSFFGLRRGSTKSHTFSILNGQQITKDRVQTVANPKTQKQQFQRAIMATVMAAYSEMKAIEDHAFEGKKKGSENQREFMSRNLVAMRNAFLQYQEENPEASGQEYFAVGPKTPTVLPGAWEISHGTLNPSRFFTYDDEEHLIFFKTISTEVAIPINDGPSGSKTLNVGEALDAFGIVPGMQFTACCINANNGQRIFQVYAEDYAGYYDWTFGYARLVLKTNIDRSQTLTTPSADNAAAKLFNQFLIAIIDESRTTVRIPSAASLEAGTAEVWADAELLLPAAGFDESLTGAIGIINSMVDVDKRSTCKMIVRNQATLGAGLGLSWEYVPDAWRNAGGSLGQSDLYLEGGNV